MAAESVAFAALDELLREAEPSESNPLPSAWTDGVFSALGAVRRRTDNEWLRSRPDHRSVLSEQRSDQRSVDQFGAAVVTGVAPLPAVPSNRLWKRSGSSMPYVVCRHAAA